MSSNLIAQDRNGEFVEVGDIVKVIDGGHYIENGIITDFLYPFVDPIQVRFAGGGAVSRQSHEIEKVSVEIAVLWKLENL